ncbi:MAG: hypothetical protein R3190_05215, partial [Thermoanaerobaculia bacterium]|nr:hypothetical protein [Thermoanaerobaculia bacterium]
ERGVDLRYELETRDFSRHFNFGDLWTRAIRSCRNEIVCWLDADFLLGAGFDAMARAAEAILAAPAPRPFGVSFEVPQLSEAIVIGTDGRLVSHGRWRMHSPRPRFVRRDDVVFHLSDNRFEKAAAREPERSQDPPLLELPPSSLISIDVKTPERQRLRRTMTVFMKWAIERGSDVCWLDAYEAGLLDDVDYPRRPDVWLDEPTFVGQHFYIDGYSS